MHPYTHDEKPPRNARFWLIFASLCVCSFLTALELGSISIALPTIIRELKGEQFIWVGSAFALGATALIPLSGGLAEIFGRRPIMLIAIMLFGVGSVVCGASKSLNMLIAARMIQGLGGGGIISLTQIIVSDLVSLRERGSFNGLVSMAYAVGVGVAPVIAGSLATRGEWRWLFYLNVPIACVAAALVLIFLNLKTPPGSLRDKLSRVDYIGNVLIVGATTAIVLALTWGGIQFSWRSGQVLASLISGLLGLAIFLLYESFFAEHPMVPLKVLSNRTSFSGYVQTFLNSMIMLLLTYYFPVYFQACYTVSAVASGVDSLPMAFIPAPCGLVAGIIVQKTNAYRIPIYVGWMTMMVGFGLLSTLDANSSRAKALGYSVICGAGFGNIILTSYFPVLAPLPVNKNAQALALFVFLRNLSYVWGITVGGAILQNQLTSRLPAEFISQFPGGAEVAYSIIPLIHELEEPFKTEVRVAFAEALKVIWWTATGLASFGLLISLLMKPFPLHTSVDDKWGMDNAKLNGEKEFGRDSWDSSSARSARVK